MTSKIEKTLANSIWTDEHFARSTNIELDYKQPDSVPDYRFTSKSLRLLDDVLDSSLGSRRDKAWSVIGPYGSGKSTFLLFLLQLLSGASSPWLQRCLIQLRLANPNIANKVDITLNKSNAKYIPIVVQGSRNALDRTLCDALLEAATGTDRDTSWVSESFLSSLNTTLQIMDSGVTDSISTIKLYERAANLVKDAGYKGLLVTIDEFGKFLERARWQGDLPDLVTAQYLAELATNSDDSQILFLVALHQGFQHYASSLSRQQWLEWVKIQGRFKQVDFSEEPENLYSLVASLINYTDISANLNEAIDQWSLRVWDQVKSLAPFKSDTDKGFWRDLLPHVYPIHPITLYALPRLSAYLGQNERTLFTFLASDDPLGLKSFLNQTQQKSDNLPSLTVDYLYDYFVHGSRVSLLPLEVQRKVLEIEAALERLGDRPTEEMRLLKTIGIISLLKAGSSLPTSEKVLGAALDIDSFEAEGQIGKTINNLIIRKIIVYRQFAEEFRIWEGSDFDFDGALEKIREDLQQSFDLTSALDRLVKSRPMFARRHSFETGTSRIFRTKLVEATVLLKMRDSDFALLPHQNQCDGVIIYSIPSTAQELDMLKHWVTKISDSRVIIVIPREPVGLHHLTLDLSSLRELQQNWPELAEDIVAIKEIAGRIESTEDYLYENLSNVIGPDTQLSTYYWRGKPQNIEDSRVLNILLSDICDESFSATPVIRNELINREALSTTVVVAVKKIIESLLADTHDPKLGFVGNGPEISIMNAVLEDTNLYKKGPDGLWYLSAPPKNSPSNIGKVWMEIEHFIQSSRSSAMTFDVLYEKLASLPYGLRKGIISLLIWITLIYFRSTITLYENGTYIRDWTIELFDKFVRMPKAFSLRQLIFFHGSGDFIRKLNAKIPNASKIKKHDGGIPLNKFLYNLFNWYSTLPVYTKNTSRLSKESDEFLRVLLTVTDPIEFIFNNIPNSLGLDITQKVINNSGEDEQRRYFKRYARKFGIIIKEIDESYDRLIVELVGFTSRRFGSLDSVTSLRKIFHSIDSETMEYVSDSEAEAFLSRAKLPQTNDALWIESITSVLTGQAPKYWEDKDVEDYKIKVSNVVMALNQARRSQYAYASLEARQKRGMKRIIIEEQGQRILEEFYGVGDIDSDIDEKSRNLLHLIEKEYSDLSTRSKQLLVARLLELLNLGSDDE